MVKKEDEEHCEWFPFEEDEEDEEPEVSDSNENMQQISMPFYTVEKEPVEVVKPFESRRAAYASIQKVLLEILKLEEAQAHKNDRQQVTLENKDIKVSIATAEYWWTNSMIIST